jgi:post-segregation antitoxin (ccd killing protein)
MKYDIQRWREELKQAETIRAEKTVPKELSNEVAAKNAAYDLARNASKGARKEMDDTQYRAWLKETYHPAQQAYFDAMGVVARYKAKWHSGQRLGELYQIRAHMRGRLHYQKRWMPCDHDGHVATGCVGRRLVTYTLADQAEMVGALVKKYELPDTYDCGRCGAKHLATVDPDYAF